jgi:hypothetical protein
VSLDERRTEGEEPHQVPGREPGAECHAEVAGALAEERGVHGTMEHRTALDCAACHLEHHGDAVALVTPASFALARLPDRERFDHRRPTREGATHASRPESALRTRAHAAARNPQPTQRSKSWTTEQVAIAAAFPNLDEGDLRVRGRRSVPRESLCGGDGPRFNAAPRSPRTLPRDGSGH